MWDRRLKTLRIDFPDNDNKFGNESSIKVVIELLSKFPKLENIILGFNFSDETITILGSEVKQIENIRNSIFYWF